MAFAIRLEDYTPAYNIAHKALKVVRRRAALLSMCRVFDRQQHVCTFDKEIGVL